MATKELRNRVDDQWRQQASLWGQENHDRERKLIYDFLDQDENIVGLVGCTWGPISAFEEDAGFVLRQQRLKGAAVATDFSVYLVSHKGFSKLVTQMPLPSITAVEHANGIVTVAGDAIHNWAGMAQDDPFQIRDVHRGWGARFAQSVQGLQGRASLNRHSALRRSIPGNEQSRTHRRSVAGPFANARSQQVRQSTQDAPRYPR